MTSSSDESSSDSSRHSPLAMASKDDESDEYEVPLVPLLRTGSLQALSPMHAMTVVVKLDNLSLNATDVRNVSHSLRQLTRLRTLSLNWTEMQAGVHSFIDLLNVNWCIRSISMNGNHITCKGAKHLARVLAVSRCSVRHLSIADNDIGAEGCEALASSFKLNTSVRSLDLSGNRMIGDRGAEALKNMLQLNTTLKVLDISECAITRARAVPLFGALSHNRRLQTVDLSSLEPSPLANPVYPFTMAASSTLRILGLRLAQLHDSDFETLCVGLRKCSRLTHLSLDGNMLTDSSCELLQCLLNSCPLGILSLCSNHFGCKTPAVLLRASLDSDRIVHLNFGSKNGNMDTCNPCGPPSQCGKSPHWKNCGLPALPVVFTVDTWAAAAKHCRVMLHAFAVDSVSRESTRRSLQHHLQRSSDDLSESEAVMLKTSDWWLHVFSKHNCPPELVSAIFQARLNIPNPNLEE
jgi:hypothetical protein